VVELLKQARESKVYAIVAPSVSSQFSYARPGQVVSGLYALGFCDVVPAALGADMVALSEARELSEKGFLTSSCCPAFVKYVKTAFPQLTENISHNPSPMVALAKYIKENDPDSKVVFIGPCIAKKAEAQLDEVKPYVDAVLTFEELQALYDSRDIDIKELDDSELSGASRFGRIFARTGGLSEACVQAMGEQNIDFEVRSAVCDGIEACRTALLKKSKGLLDANFIEGMACIGGCIGGAGCLTHGEKNKAEVDKYGMESKIDSITEAVNRYTAK
jgi:iron only hydrogenase large subunit-like protein